MILICPHCGHRTEYQRQPSNGVYLCRSCQGKFSLPVEPPLPPEASSSQPLRSVPAPIVVPIPVNMGEMNPFAFDPDEIEDERRDRKERREESRDERQLRKLERQSNPLGITSLAISITTLLLMCSGLGFRTELPFYTGLAACLGIPGSLAGLVCGIIGLCRPGRPRILAGVGTGVSAVILLLFIPLVLTDLTSGTKK